MTEREPGAKDSGDLEGFRANLVRILRKARPDRGLPEEIFNECIEEVFGSCLSKSLLDWRYGRGVLHLVLRSHAACSDASFHLEELRRRINARLEEAMEKETSRPARTGRTRAWVRRIRMETGTA